MQASLHPVSISTHAYVKPLVSPANGDADSPRLVRVAFGVIVCLLLGY